METLLQDLKYACRGLARSPGFTAVAVLTLALGIGANTAIFSAVNALLLRPLPYPSGDRLYTLQQNQSLLDFEDMKAGATLFESAGCVTSQPLDDTGGAEPVQVRGALTDRGLFEALGVRPTLGRTFTAAEDAVGGERVVVLSHGFWRRRFGDDAGVIGRTIPLSGNPYTIVGVLPPSFALPESQADVYAPLLVVSPVAARHRGVHFLRLYFRLKEGAPLEQAQTQLDAVATRLSETDPAESKGRRLDLVPLRERLAGDARPAVLVLFGAVGFVLLIASANFASLLLSRAIARRREVGIRAALGAGRGRLVAQLLTESLVLSLLGGAAGLALAPWLIRLLLALRPAEIPAVFAIDIDPAVLAFTFATAVTTGLLFGLVPALGATRQAGGLAETGRGRTAGPSRSQASGLLVVGETALALVLAVGAGLLMKTFFSLRSTSPGFDPDRLVTMRVELPEARYRDVATQIAFRGRLLEEVSSVPGLSAATVSDLPLSGDSLTHDMAFEGRESVAVGDEPEIATRCVAGDYFRTMRIPLLSGRDLTRDDRAGTPLVGVVNEALVRAAFRGQDPIGKRVRWARQTPLEWITIVGVVADVRHFGLESGDGPALYTPHDQARQAWKRWMTLVVRCDARADPAAAVLKVKSKLAAIDPDLPLTKVRTMRDVLGASLERERFSMALLGLFAALALLLAATGLYGVMSHAVSQRTREIGIRMSLGAAPREVLELVIGHGMRLSLAGIGIGVFGALLLTRLLTSLLHGVSPTDLPTFLVLSLALSGVALAACAVPARRATRVDPVIALRDE